MKEGFLSGAGVLLICLGIFNVLIMLEILGRKGSSGKLRNIHRWAGRTFVVGFLAFFVYMLPRARFMGGLPAYELFHSLMAFAVIPLVIGKYLVVTRYKNYLGSAVQLGVIVMIGALLIVVTTAGPNLLSKLYGG
jgi:hypothetical protein